jgi:hypothetical protein
MLNNAKVQKILNKSIRKNKEFDSDQTFKIERKLARQSKRFNQQQGV